MSEADWYEVADGPEILQGDVLIHCPVFAVDRDLPWPFVATSEVGIRVKIIDLVVMTQSCDLLNEKVDEVLLAQMVAWPEAVRAEVQRGNEAVKSTRFRKLLVDGSVPGLSLLHKREQNPSLPWSVVDFHQLFTLPKAFVGHFAASAGPRLRLRSPYREHLAQAFARYFMRVGLPHDAKSFEKEGEAIV